MASKPLSARPDASGPGVSPPRRRYSVPAVEKCFEVLELLASVEGGLSITEIGRRLGRSMGEVYRIIQVMEAHGYIVRNLLTDDYNLSLKLFELAHRHPPTRRVVETARPEMRNLALDVGQSCHLAVRRDLAIIILAQQDSALPMQYAVKEGARFTIWDTSSGMVLLAHEPDEVCAALVRQITDQPGAPAHADMVARIRAVRAYGGERLNSLEVSGVVNLCRPVIGHAGQIVAALTVPYLAQRQANTGIDECEARLALTARRISRGLGLPVSPPDPDPDRMAGDAELQGV